MNLTQPKIKVPATKWERLSNLLSVILIIVTCTYVFQKFDSLPETIPTHFNARGVPDGWGSKSTLFIVPIISTVLFIFLYFLNKVPHIYNLPVKITEENAAQIYPLARTMMAVFNFEMVAILSYTTWEIIQAAQGNSVLGVWFIVGVFLIPLVTLLLFIIPMRRHR